MVQGQRAKRRGGFTLLELVVTAALAGILASSVFVLLRTSQTAWELQQDDLAKLESAHACVRHLVRCVRQANAVVAVSSAADSSGSLSLLMPSGQTYVWDHTGTQVNFGVTTADTLLANNIQSFTLTCYKADGSTATTTPAEVQCIDCTVTVQLNKAVGALRSVRCRAWRRSF